MRVPQARGDLDFADEPLGIELGSQGRMQDLENDKVARGVERRRAKTAFDRLYCAPTPQASIVCRCVESDSARQPVSAQSAILPATSVEYH